jgi:hypothetical protein
MTWDMSIIVCTCSWPSGQELNFADSAGASTPSGIPDDRGKFGFVLLWPSRALATTTDILREDSALHTLTVDNRVLNRLTANGRHVNRLSCELQTAPFEPTTDCFITLPSSNSGGLSMIHDSHYGLIRQTSERSITNLVSVNEIWFVQSDEVQTPIECWHDERHPEREQDKHLFEVKPPECPRRGEIQSSADAPLAGHHMAAYTECPEWAPKRIRPALRLCALQARALTAPSPQPTHGEKCRKGPPFGSA